MASDASKPFMLHVHVFALSVYSTFVFWRMAFKHPQLEDIARGSLMLSASSVCYLYLYPWNYAWVAYPLSVVCALYCWIPVLLSYIRGVSRWLKKWIGPFAYLRPTCPLPSTYVPLPFHQG